MTRLTKESGLSASEACTTVTSRPPGSAALSLATGNVRRSNHPLPLVLMRDRGRKDDIPLLVCTVFR